MNCEYALDNLINMCVLAVVWYMWGCPFMPGISIKISSLNIGGVKRERAWTSSGRIICMKKLEANAKENLCLFTFKACRRKLDLWFLEKSCVWNIKSCKRQQCHLEEKLHLQSRFQLILQFTSTWHHHTRNNFSISIPIIRDEENLSKQH